MRPRTAWKSPHSRRERAADEFNRHVPGAAVTEWCGGQGNHPSGHRRERLLWRENDRLRSDRDREAAFDAHRQVLALATSDATLGVQLFRLAVASRDLGKRDEAVRALKTALDQFPDRQHRIQRAFRGFPR